MRILCLDMDSFFASVEMASRPELRKIPMAVAGSGQRTVILSASYSARKKGVKTGSTVQDALKACPGLTIVKASNRKYTYVSSLIAEYLHSVSPKARMYSVDEAFLDITDKKESSAEIAYRIKTWLKQNLKITGSVGVGESYILAKMASDVNKPDGFCEVEPKDRFTFMDGFTLRQIWGIGRKTTEKLNSMGLYTPADVRRFGKDRLFELYGVTGHSIYNSCCGLDKEHMVDKDAPLKSISHSITAPEDIRTPDIALAYLLQLSETVSMRARKRMYSGRTVSLYIKDTELKMSSFRVDMGFHTSATHHIYETAKTILTSKVSFETPVRLIGVGIDNLIHGGAVLCNLDDVLSGNDDRYINLYKAIDAINNKYTNGLVHAAVMKINYRQPQVIPPTFKKDTFWRIQEETDNW